MARGAGRGQGESETSRRRIAAAERRRDALELRKAGHTYQTIGEHLGMNTSSAHEAVTLALREITKDAAEDVLAIELARLDHVVVAIWPDVIKGKLASIDRLVKTMERRAKMLGLDTPARVEHSGPDRGPITITGIEIPLPAREDGELSDAEREP